MPDDDLKKIFRPVTRLLDSAEAWLRPVDRLDYAIRRQLIPVPFREPQQVLISSQVQAEIGQRLREQYAIERSLPVRLANLLGQFEDMKGAVPRADYPRTA